MASGVIAARIDEGKMVMAILDVACPMKRAEPIISQLLNITVETLISTSITL